MDKVKAEAKRLTKTDLVNAVADEAEVTKVEAKKVIDAMLEVITRSLVAGEKITLTGFGTFEVRTSKARTGINPRTLEKIKIPATPRVSFAAGALLKQVVKK